MKIILVIVSCVVVLLLAAVVVCIALFGVPSIAEVLMVWDSWTQDCAEPIVLSEMAISIALPLGDGQEIAYEECKDLAPLACRQHLLELSLSKGCAATTGADALLGEHLHAMGKYREAVPYLEGYLRRQYDPQAIEWLADSYERLGDLDAAASLRSRPRR